MNLLLIGIVIHAKKATPGVLGALMTQLYPVPSLFHHAPSILIHPLLYLAVLSYFFRFSKTNTINELLC